MGGFTAQKWDNDMPVIGMNQEWEELSADLQAAAVTLGYDQQTWCDGEDQYIKEEAVQFINYDWEELPQNVKDAAHILGFNHEVWDNGGKTPHTDKEWQELSTAQQNAAVTLGHTKSLWCDDYLEYEEEERAVNFVNDAAHILGFDHEVWDNDGKTPHTGKDWHELSTAQQNAAATLGYTKQIWCDNYEDYLAAEQAVNWIDEDWRDLPSTVQQAAMILGFTAPLWDNNGRTEHTEKDWKDLSQEQYAAAKTLGYTEQLWCDDDSDSASVSVSESSSEEDGANIFTNNNNNWDQKDWIDFPPNVQSAAATLWFTSTLWDADQHTPTNIAKDWNELTATETQAATTLGYTEQTWCQDDSQDSSSSSDE